MMRNKHKLFYCTTRMTSPQLFRCIIAMIANAILIVIPVVLLVLIPPVQVHGFASYLLSKSSCKQPLKVGDIMMNYPIKSYIDSSDPTMLIQAVGINNYDNNDNNIQHINTTTVLISPDVSLPVSIDIHVTSTSNPDETDYQWVIEVVNKQEQHQQEQQPKAYFNKGSCINNGRIAGIGTTIVSITIVQHGAQIVAGWASGYVSVKLTPILTFITSTTIPIDYNNINNGNINIQKLITDNNNNNNHLHKHNQHQNQSQEKEEEDDEEIMLRMYTIVFFATFIFFIVYVLYRYCCCFWNKNQKSNGYKV